MTARIPDETEAHFQMCLAVWRQWMGTGDSHRLGVPTRDSVCGNSKTNYMASEEDPEAASELAETQYVSSMGQAVNACMESLMPSERHAVLMAQGFSRVWPFRNLDYGGQLVLGMATLRALVRKRC